MTPRGHITPAEQEALRLKALSDYRMLDVPLENELKGFTKIAALMCNTPVAYISLIDENKLWFKSSIGITVSALPREQTYCWKTLAGRGIHVINDTLQEDAIHSVVYTAQHVRFYAGIPLQTGNGQHIGTIAVMDFVARELSDDQAEALKVLANDVIARLDLTLKHKDYQSGIKRVLERRYTRLGHYHNSILNGTHYAVIFTNKQGLIKTFNTGAEKMLGYSNEELVDKASPVIFHLEEELQARAQIIKKESGSLPAGFETLITRAKEGITDVNEWTYTRKDGSQLTVQLSVKSLEDEDEGVIGYLAIAEDISEKSLIEKKLKHSEERHRLFFENSQGIMFTHDASGNLISLNDAGAEFLGYTPLELIGKNITEIVPSSLRHTIKNYLESISSNGNDSGVIKLVHKNGSTRVGLYKNSLISDGTRNLVIGNAIDISARVELEKNLKKAKQLAERNAEAKDRFLANMSHEIRTPMNAILGFTDVLANTPLNDEQSEYLGIIKTAGDNLLGLLNDILDVSKIESGKISFESLPFSISESAKSICDLMQVKAAAKALTLELSIDRNVPFVVMGDRLRLNQVLFNLIGNAVKFTEKGKISVFISMMEETDTQYIVHFTVSDTGIGIPADKQAGIFERFIQVSSETTRKYGGTGLGLSISKNLVAMQGGTFHLESTLGKGSSFRFTLSFLKAKSDQTQPELKKIPQPGKNAAQVKLLLVEDNELNQRLAKKVITNFGFSLDVAENGRIGLEKLKEQSYDLVLMDLQMPELDGYQATEAIRKDLKLTVPIIAMTAHSLVGEKDKCMAIGMDDYLTKPFKAEELYYKIETLINKKKHMNTMDLKPATFPGRVSMEYLKELSGGSIEFEQEMIELFIQKVPADMLSIEEAIKRLDGTTIKKATHKLKSSFSLFKLTDLLYQQAKMDELVNVSFSANDINIIFNTMKRDLEAVFRELKELLRTSYNVSANGNE